MSIKMSRLLVVAAAAALMAGCQTTQNTTDTPAANQSQTERTQQTQSEQTERTQQAQSTQTKRTQSDQAPQKSVTPSDIKVYVADLQPLNSKVTGSQTSGQAVLTLNGDELTIDILINNAPASIEHWQHIHGFTDGRDARTPTMADDKNHDGIVDLIETTEASGTTMIPFNSDPVAMHIPNNTYPKASADGSYHYHSVVSYKALKAAFHKAFPDQELDLSKRVIYIHGVPANTKLPSTVASLGDIPAQVTLPIAAGKITSR